MRRDRALPIVGPTTGGAPWRGASRVLGSGGGLGRLMIGTAAVATPIIALHVATALLDGYAPIGLLAVLIPGTAGYRPLWLGLGAVALDLLLAVLATSLVRHRLGHRTWRLVH
jgi:sulfoxide reductase heme-binding subunit YedZ